MILSRGYRNPVLLLHPLGGWTKADDVPLKVTTTLSQWSHRGLMLVSPHGLIVVSEWSPVVSQWFHYGPQWSPLVS